MNIDLFLMIEDRLLLIDIVAWLSKHTSRNCIKSKFSAVCWSIPNHEFSQGEQGDATNNITTEKLYSAVCTSVRARTSTFACDMDHRRIFENRYNRQQDLIGMDVIALEVATKVKLVVPKLNTSLYAHYLLTFFPKNYYRSIQNKACGR